MILQSNSTPLVVITSNPWVRIIFRKVNESLYRITIAFFQSGTAAKRSAYNRPLIKERISPRYAVTVFLSTHLRDAQDVRTRSAFGPKMLAGTLLVASSVGSAGAGGFLLGGMLASMFYRDKDCCYDCGCGYNGSEPNWYLTSYIPFDLRNGLNETTENATLTTLYDRIGTKNVTNNIVARKAKRKSELCALARWNMELPFSELPNMMLTYLASINVSGDTAQSKAT